MIQKAKTATDVVHVRQGKRKRIVQEPLFMSGYGMKRGSGCGEGSPAPSALHVRVVLPISTSAGIASLGQRIFLVGKLSFKRIA